MDLSAAAALRLLVAILTCRFSLSYIAIITWRGLAFNLYIIMIILGGIVCLTVWATSAFN